MASKLVEVVVSSSCICEDFDEDTGEAIAAEWCFGCFEEAIEELDNYVVSPFVDHNPEINRFMVEGRGMGWTKATGVAEVAPDASDIVGLLSVNGDYRLVFNANNEFITVVRYSHDEPTGASFLFTALKEED